MCCPDVPSKLSPYLYTNFNFPCSSHPIVPPQGSAIAKGTVDPAHTFNFRLANTSLSPVSPTAASGSISFAVSTVGPPALEVDLNHKRMAISARRIHPLHVSGIVEIRDKVAAKTMQDPRVYGREEHYVWTKCWGAESGRHDGGLGISVSRPTPTLPTGLNPNGTQPGPGVIDDNGTSGVVKLPKLSNCLTITDDVIPPVDLPVPPHTTK